MNLKPLILTTLLSATLGVLIFSPQSSQAQTERRCEFDGNFEPASETNRTVELPDFDITIEIPSNYRTMQGQDGSVQIVHPNYFEFFQCIAQGGIVQGGSGAMDYSVLTIQTVTRDLSMSPREQATWEITRYSQDRNSNSIAPEMIDYQHSNLDGYLVSSARGGIGYFLGYVPGRNQLLRISRDFNSIEALMDLLESVKPLE